MKKFRDNFYRYVWNLNDRQRTILCGCIAVLVTVSLFRWKGWEIACISGWIVGVSSYLLLLGTVIISADGPRTQQHISKTDPNATVLLILLTVVILLSNIFVGIILTSVGDRPHSHIQLLVGFSMVAVLLSWLLLHTTFGQQYARIYYDVADTHGRPFPGGLRRGLAFPGANQPAYLDFLYVSFTIALTYATSDVNIECDYLRKLVLIHSLVSFFFYSISLGSVLNAVVTS